MKHLVGLQQGRVRLVKHRRIWPAVFECEKKALLKRLGGLVVKIEHIGSTAVCGLDAKPIIDITVGVRRLGDAGKLVRPLSTMGYRFYKRFGRQLLFAKGSERRRTCYLHIMRYGGAKWKSDILFRDYLLHHPTRAKRYAFLKRDLARAYPVNRNRYSAGKRPFIEATLGLARRWREQLRRR
jgi:GrpB-like predicted nucleotidyltransferase (UPF0157 family)